MTQSMCDAEIGKPGNWHCCGRKATARIWTGNFFLEFCDRHHSRAFPPHGQPAPFAELEPIPKMEV